jgi:hypothetical protein
MEVSGQLHSPAAVPREKKIYTHCIGSLVVVPSGGLDISGEDKYNQVISAEC